MIAWVIFFVAMVLVTYSLRDTDSFVFARRCTIFYVGFSLSLMMFNYFTIGRMFA